MIKSPSTIFITVYLERFTIQVVVAMKMIEIFTSRSHDSFHIIITCLNKLNKLLTSCWFNKWKLLICNHHYWIPKISRYFSLASNLFILCNTFHSSTLIELCRIFFIINENSSRRTKKSRVYFHTIDTLMQKILNICAQKLLRDGRENRDI